VAKFTHWGTTLTSQNNKHAANEDRNQGMIVFPFGTWKHNKLKHTKLFLPAVSCWCENFSFRLREEHTLSMFENSVLTKTFASKSKEAKGAGRKLHAEGLHDLYYWASNVACMGETWN
jgi:hypothetical protein